MGARDDLCPAHRAWYDMMSARSCTERLYDVFGRPKPGAPSVLLGTVLATDDQLARLYASQVYGRRGENCDIAIMERLEPKKTEPYHRVLDSKNLRAALGYRRYNATARGAR